MSSNARRRRPRPRRAGAGAGAGGGASQAPQQGARGHERSEAKHAGAKQTRTVQETAAILARARARRDRRRSTAGTGAAASGGTEPGSNDAADRVDMGATTPATPPQAPRGQRDAASPSPGSTGHARTNGRSAGGSSSGAGSGGGVAEATPRRLHPAVSRAAQVQRRASPRGVKALARRREAGRGDVGDLTIGTNAAGAGLMLRRALARSNTDGGVIGTGGTRAGVGGDSDDAPATPVTKAVRQGPRATGAAAAALSAQIGRHRGPAKRHRPAALRKLMDGSAAAAQKAEERKRGQEIDRRHELYQLSFGMMKGVHTMVSKHSQRTDLHKDDFWYKVKFEYTPGPSDDLQVPFKFKTYAPNVFRHIRERFGIDDDEYQRSFSGAYNLIEFVSNSKSGQFFFFNHDRKFMIKTQSGTEYKFLRRIMLQYYMFVMDNPHTYVTRFYGMYRLKMKHIGQKIHFVVMQSVFEPDKEIHETYDLKGSMAGRFVKEKELEKGEQNVVFKDVDLINRGRVLKLGKQKKQFLRQLDVDTKFLDDMKIMDYSLLLGIHYRSKANVKGFKRPSVHLNADDALRLERMVKLAQATNAKKAKPASAGASDGSGTDSSSSDDEATSDGGSAAGAAAGDSGETGSGVAAGDSVAATGAGGGAGAGAGAGAAALRPTRRKAPSRPAKADGSMRRVKTMQPKGAGPGKTTPHKRATKKAVPRRRRKLDIFTHPDDLVINGCNADGSRSDEVYYVGIIDILQQYNTKKKLETVFKGMVTDTYKISSVDPHTYAKRFVKFMDANSVGVGGKR